MNELEILLMQINDNTVVDIPQHTIRNMIRGKMDRLWDAIEQAKFQDTFEGLVFEEECPFE